MYEFIRKLLIKALPECKINTHNEYVINVPEHLTLENSKNKWEFWNVEGIFGWLLWYDGKDTMNIDIENDRIKVMRFWDGQTCYSEKLSDPGVDPTEFIKDMISQVPQSWPSPL